MFSRITTLLAAACLLTTAADSASAHSGKARFHVIVDTDGAADDLRTLCMLLGNHDTEVLGVVSSPGAQRTRRTAICARALLAALHHDGIPVGCGREGCAAAPAWRDHSENTLWGEEVESRQQTDAVQLIESIIDGEEEPVTIVALGALTNMSDLLRRCPEKARRIERVVWYDDLPCGTGANYKADARAAQHVLSCGVPVEIVSDNGSRHLVVDERFVAAVAAIPTPYTRHIAATHRRPPLDRLVAERHLTAWDDLTALYLLCPEIFVRHPLDDTVMCCTIADDISPECVERMLLSVLWGRPDAENRVFYDFPSCGQTYAADVRAIMPLAVDRHGASEWRAAVLTNEMHGHLGIYATIGVKMGMRAREWFGIGVDDMEVVSCAGLTPPLSCMNDGLQVSTGASLGHGLIRIAEVDTPSPEARFAFKGRTLRLRLKEEYARRIAEDCRRGAEQCGGLNEEYWQYVRALALKYWLDFDRHEIFYVEELQ